ncbi:Far upstream element-binding protein 2 [Auxenochlorella protothecoides]|uniref:Far upstream element-binding protein 2 n=1 Tax=Auxenochlorella protothecoides TaxID=3075 RepID=A0A087SGX6_AUXPR|nr:Far upstream element-binding protein 2 [Auxenochlorella protothecoides]KFM24980.1 Far upstream element-binding protein 2 [Auxenochlorella protothecoides]
MQGLLTVSKPPSGSGFQARGSGPSSARGPGNLYRPTNPQGAGVQKTSTPPPPIRVRASAAHVDAHGAASYHTPAHRDEGYQGPRSLSVNDSPFQFKFLLPDAVTGAAVGRNGSTVNAIKQQTGTFMQFCRYNSATTYPTERLLIFASPSVASAAAALRVLLDCLAAVPGALERLAPRPGSPELALRIVIPGHCAGAVMGPGGETIKALGARTCFRMLPVAERRVGALLGPAGAHIRALQDVLRVRMGVEDGADLAGVKHVSFWGPVENVDVAMRALSAVIELMPAGRS